MTHIQTAPLTPELEAQIGTAPMVPITAQAAAEHFGSHKLYAHRQDHADCGLPAFLRVRIVATSRQAGQRNRYITECKHGYQTTLEADGLLFVTQRSWDWVAGIAQAVAA